MIESGEREQRRPAFVGRTAPKELRHVSVEALAKLAANDLRRMPDHGTECRGNDTVESVGTRDSKCGVDKVGFNGAPARFEGSQPFVVELSPTKIEQHITVLTRPLDRAPEERVIRPMRPRRPL